VEIVFAAFITGVCGILIARETAKKASDRVIAKIQTNHGMDPWQYLEMVADVREEVIAFRKEQREHVRLNSQDHEMLRLMQRAMDQRLRHVENELDIAA
jgi:hypothetical protein